MGRLLAILWVRRGLRQPSRFAVRSTTVSIGRDAGNDLVLDAASVSARHATLALAGGVWTLTDHGSMNGSRVDGEAVGESLPLAPGSEIRLGEVVLAFAPRDQWHDSPLPSAPADVPAPVSHFSSPLFAPPEAAPGAATYLLRGAVVLLLGFVAYLLLAMR